MFSNISIYKWRHIKNISIILLYFISGILFFNLYEKWSVIQSLFFTVVTITTVGKF